MKKKLSVLFFLAVVTMSVGCGSSSGTTPTPTPTPGDQVSDTFQTNTQANWTVDTAVSSAGLQTWDQLTSNGVLSISSGLNYNLSSALLRADIYKEITFTSTGFTAYIDITPTSKVARNFEQIMLSVRNADGTIYISAGLHGDALDLTEGDQRCGVAFQEGGADPVLAESADPCPDGATYRITMAVDTANGMTASYTTGGVTRTLTPSNGSFPDATNVNAKILQYAGQTWRFQISTMSGYSTPAGVINEVVATGLTLAP